MLDLSSHSQPLSGEHIRLQQIAISWGRKGVGKGEVWGRKGDGGGGGVVEGGYGKGKIYHPHQLSSCF